MSSATIWKNLLPTITDNCLGVDLDAPIYRITGVEYVIDDARKDRFTMTRIDRRQWSDPEENGLLIANYKTEQGEDVGLGNLTKNFFASCWSDRPLGTGEDWEGFSHAQHAVRIESTPRKLLSGLTSAAVDSYGQLKIWIGKVAYEPQENINSFFDDPNWEKHLDTTNRRLIQTVLRLRTSWNKEKEVRLIFDRFGDDWDAQNTQLLPSSSNALRVAIRFNWKDAITGIYPGPTLSNNSLTELRRVLGLASPDDEATI